MIYNRFHGVHNKKKKYSYYLLAAKSYSDAVSKLEKRYEDYSILRIKDLMEVSEGSVIYIGNSDTIKETEALLKKIMIFYPIKNE